MALVKAVEYLAHFINVSRQAFDDLPGLALYFDQSLMTGIERAIEYEKYRWFLWAGEMFDLPGKYEENRQTYPTLESCLPEVLKSFNELAALPDP